VPQPTTLPRAPTYILRTVVIRGEEEEEIDEDDDEKIS
jgi:hypothetical protein